MIFIQELLELTMFQDFELVAGADGINREMESIVILEHESYRNIYDDFDEKDFVLSSLFFAKDDPDLIEEAVENLMKREVAGIAIKTVFFTELPERVIQLANQKKIPIFLFHNAYMEDLIISANELLKSKLQYLVLEERVTRLLEHAPTEKENSMTSYEINPYFGKHLVAAYIRPKWRDGKKTLEMNFGRLIYKHFQLKGIQDYAFVKYRDGMFVVFSLETRSENVQQHLLQILKRIDLRPNQYDIGLATKYQPKEHLSVLLEQALFANRICQMKQEEIVEFSKLGSYQFITPLLETPALREGYEEKIELLKKYDEEHTSDILETLEIFVENNGEIAKTAETLYQHPNTVRYRLKKAGSLLECEEKDFFVYVTILMRIYQLNKYSRI